MSGSEGEMEPLDVWEGGLDFCLRIEKETKRQEHTGLYLKEYTKGGKEGQEGGAEGTREEREGKWGGGQDFISLFRDLLSGEAKAGCVALKELRGLSAVLSTAGSPIAQKVKTLTLGPSHYHTIEGLDSSEPRLPPADFEFPWKLKKKKEQGCPSR